MHYLNFAESSKATKTPKHKHAHRESLQLTVRIYAKHTCRPESDSKNQNAPIYLNLKFLEKYLDEMPNKDAQLKAQRFRSCTKMLAGHRCYGKSYLLGTD